MHSGDKGKLELTGPVKLAVGTGGLYRFPMSKTSALPALSLRSLTVTLSAEQVERLECVVRSGAYGSCDDIVQEALDLWIRSDAATPGRLHLPPEDPFSIVDDAFRWHEQAVDDAADEEP